MKRTPGPFLIAAGALLLLCGGCSSEPEGTVIARVGDAVLTMEEAKAALDAGAPDFPQRLNQYVTSWVNSELLHQEALRLGIEGAPEFEERLASLRRQLANQELLDRLVYSDSATFDESELRSYFAAHTDEFTITEDHVKLRLAAFRGREAARRFAQSASARDAWTALIDSLGADPRMSGEIVTSTPERWYTRSTIYPPELWKVAGTLSPGEVSFPVKTGDGYTVMQYVAGSPTGKTTEFEVVRDEVRTRMLIERRRSVFESLLGTLRERYGVEVNVHNPGSSSAQ